MADKSAEVAAWMAKAQELLKLAVYVGIEHGKPVTFIAFDKQETANALSEALGNVARLTTTRPTSW